MINCKIYGFSLNTIFFSNLSKKNFITKIIAQKKRQLFTVIAFLLKIISKLKGLKKTYCVAKRESKSKNCQLKVFVSML